MNTPHEDGLRMPAEWAEHESCVMAWPTSREALWPGRLDDAKQDYAAMARAVAGFEPVLMVCNPGSAAEVVDLCGAGVSAVEIPIDDSWTRDTGPLVVTDGAGRRAAVHSALQRLGREVLARAGRRAGHGRRACWTSAVYDAPLTSEGGAFFVDGEGTLITTSGAVLNENRNPGLSRGVSSGGCSTTSVPSWWCGWRPTRTGTPTATSTGSRSTSPLASW